jgi:hypothetical protein
MSGVRRAARATARRPSDDFRPREAAATAASIHALNGIAVVLNHPNAVTQEKDTLYLIASSCRATKKQGRLLRLHQPVVSPIASQACERGTSG